MLLFKGRVFPALIVGLDREKSSGQFLHFSGMFICVKAIIIAMNIINSVAANTAPPTARRSDTIDMSMF